MSDNKKMQVKGKKITMIECNEFIFNPTGNGVVNFAYRLVVDESEEFLKSMKAKNEAKSDKVDEDVKCEKEAKDIEKSQDVKCETEITEVKVHFPSPVIKAIMPPEPKISLTRRALPTIKEENENEKELAERRFLEEFCEGHAPPPEEDDDWSNDPPVNKSESTLSKKQGIVRRTDEKGNVYVDVPKDVQERLKSMPQYQNYMRMKREASEATKEIKAAAAAEEEKEVKEETKNNVDRNKRVRRS